MSISTVVTRGYGSFGSIAEVVTRGYTIRIAAQISRGDLGLTEEEYRAALKQEKQLLARRKKLEERKRRNAELIRKLLRQVAGLEVEPEAVSEAIEAVEDEQAEIAAEIAQAPLVVDFKAVMAKQEALESRISYLGRAIEAYEADRMEEDDMETLILLMH